MPNAKNRVIPRKTEGFVGCKIYTGIYTTMLRFHLKTCILFCIVGVLKYSTAVRMSVAVEVMYPPQIKIDQVTSCTPAIENTYQVLVLVHTYIRVRTYTLTQHVYKYKDTPKGGSCQVL